MRIAHVTYTYEPVAGGADVYLRALFALLEKQGHSQRVYQRASGARGEHLRFVNNPLNRVPGAFWTHAAMLWRHWGALSCEDALICHYPAYLLACAPVRMMSREATGAGSSDPSAGWRTRLREKPRPQRRGKVRLIGVSHGVTWDDRPGSARSAVKCALARAAFRRADLFVANDSYFLREMGLRVMPGERAFMRVADKAWFIPNCVEARKYRGAEPLPAIAALEPVLVPRHLYRNRGVHLAIEAFAEFARRYPRSHLLIVGAASQPRYVRSLARQVEALGLRGRVIFHGPVAPDEMARLYASARLTVIPSIAGEGTSLAALESMATGVATVCTRVAGLADLPAVHSAPDAEPLARAMLEAYEMRDEIGARQRQVVEQEFNIERWEKAWLRALENAGVARSEQQ